MDSNINNLIVTILIGLLLALLIHFLGCPEPKITQLSNSNDSNDSNKEIDIMANNNLIENFTSQSVSDSNNVNSPNTDTNDSSELNEDQCVDFKEDSTEIDQNLDENYLNEDTNFSDDEKMYHLIKRYNQDIILEKVKQDYEKINQLDRLEIKLKKMKQVLEGFNNQQTLYNTNGSITKVN